MRTRKKSTAHAHLVRTSGNQPDGAFIRRRLRWPASVLDPKRSDGPRWPRHLIDGQDLELAGEPAFAGLWTE